MPQKLSSLDKALLDDDPFSFLESAYASLLQLPEIRKALAKDHIEKTPARVVKALRELIEGYYQDPVVILKTGFSKGTYNEMITVSNIKFTSLCAHHMLAFTGQVHFAYIPDKTIVGLSKIPRMVEAFSRRLQVQENLSEDIVDCFQSTVQPKGCAVRIEASHQCACVRGVKKEGMVMKTTALRGIFERDESAKHEFLASIR